MKKMIRILAAVLAMMMVCPMAFAAVENVAMPLVTEPVTLKILTQDSPYTTTFSKVEDAPIWKWLEERTGIHFEIESYSPEDLKSKLPLILSDPDNYPDIFWAATLTEDQVASYGAQGMLLELSQYVDSGLAPSIKAAWEQNPAYYGMAVSPDGKVYALPAYNAPTSNGVTPWTLQINDVWMKNCGITEYPTTLAELKELLIAFRDMDANGNGDPNDEIPMEGNFGHVMQVLGNAHGLMLDWPWKGAIYGSDKGSTETYAVFTDERYKALINYLYDLYAEGLLETDYLTRTGDEQSARLLSDRYGVRANGITAKDGMYDPDQWTSISLLTSEHISEPVGFAGPGYQVCMAAVSAYTKHPEAAVKFLDFCMTTDGSALFSDNHDSLKLEESGVSADVVELLKPYIESETHPRELYGTYGNRFLPGLIWEENSESMTNAAKTRVTNIKANYNYKGNTVAQYTYSLKFTEEENEVIAQYKTDIDTYAIQKMNEWLVNGKIDEEWDAYIKQLKAMGLEELNKVHQNAVNRWYGVE